MRLRNSAEDGEIYPSEGRRCDSHSKSLTKLKGYWFVFFFDFDKIPSSLLIFFGQCERQKNQKMERKSFQSAHQ